MRKDLKRPQNLRIETMKPTIILLALLTCLACQNKPNEQKAQQETE